MIILSSVVIAREHPYMTIRMGVKKEEQNIIITSTKCCPPLALMKLASLCFTPSYGGHDLISMLPYAHCSINYGA